MWKEIVKRIDAETDVALREEALAIMDDFRDVGFEVRGDSESIRVESKEGIIESEFRIEGVLEWALKYIGERLIGTRLTNDDHVGYRIDAMVGDSRMNVDIYLGHFKDRHYIGIYGIKPKKLTQEDISMLKELLEVF
mgnify:CR=1 FL=1|tara:strand:- start:1045 stop:1455 length:411 start_codon:yes stop_codon:yes gene_type:complete